MSNPNAVLCVLIEYEWLASNETLLKLNQLHCFFKKKKSIALESCSCRFQTPTASILMLSELWSPWSKYAINVRLYIYILARSQLQCLGSRYSSTTLNFCCNIRHQPKIQYDSLEEWLPVMIDVGMFIIFFSFEITMQFCSCISLSILKVHFNCCSLPYLVSC